MDNSTMILLGRINFLEQENAYLKDLLERWAKLFSILVKKEKQND